MTRTAGSPEVYTMGEARALHEPSGLWHYVRVYAPNPDAAKLALAEEALRRKWTLDGSSIRYTESRKGVWQG